MDINTNIRILSPVASELPQQRQPSPSVKGNTEQTVQKPDNVDAVSAAAVNKPQKTNAELDDAVLAINNYVQNIQRDLQFSVDEDSGRNVVKVIDAKSKEVIRQIPSEEILALARQWAQQHGDDTGFNLLKTTA